MTELLEQVKQARLASYSLSASSLEIRNDFLSNLKNELQMNKEEIFEANNEDKAAAKTNELNLSLLKRLDLQVNKLETLSTGLDQLTMLPDPLNKTTFARELDVGLNLYRVTCSIGVLCIIFESRPEAVIQITSLAIKSGNCVVLKGGKEAKKTNEALVRVIHKALEKAGLPKECVLLVQTREEINELIAMDKYIDLIIPRGSNQLVRYIMDNTHIPVMGHADGICHVYVDQHANLEKAVSIAVDSKTEYPAVCNAAECILVHDRVKNDFLPKLAKGLRTKNTIMHCDPAAYAILSPNHPDSVKKLYEGAVPADDSVFKREYLDYEVSIVVVKDVSEAIDFINSYGSHHTDCIVSENAAAVEKFLNKVDSAGVFHNASTRFADGFRYGFGAEVGVSTNKLHARGPVGMEGLLTYKYKVLGNGHIVAPYNTGEKKYTHNDLKLE